MVLGEYKLGHLFYVAITWTLHLKYSDHGKQVNKNDPKRQTLQIIFADFLVNIYAPNNAS